MASYLFAPDSFKGSLTSRRACQILQEELASTDPDSSARSVCIGDGGEGTLDAIVAASGGSLVSEVVSGPLGRPVRASYGRMRDGSAVVELASASGLPLLSMEERSPRLTSTYGTGQLIGRAMAAGARHIVVSLGGSATNDGGMGAMRALGVRFCDSQGEQLEGRGCDLARVRKIDLDDIDPLVAQTTFDVLCDVDNPLVGSRGATRVFSAQKGATPADVIELEHGMQSFSQVLQETFGRDVASVPGAGAAGGMGMACQVFLGARTASGIQTVLDLVHFDDLVRDVDVCVTAEGHFDASSLRGKATGGVAERCKRLGVACVAIVGGCSSDAMPAATAAGIIAVVPTVRDATPLGEVMASAERDFRLAARELFSLVRLGSSSRPSDVSRAGTSS